MPKRKARGTPGDKTICLPIEENIDYETLVKDKVEFRKYLDEEIARHPEIFPKEIESGYYFHGFVKSGRLGITTRRIRLKKDRKKAYQIRPDTVMPYMVGLTEEVEKGLYLRSHGLSYEAIAYVLGHNPMYWYKATQAIGRSSIVGTTVKDPEAIPPSSDC